MGRAGAKRILAPKSPDLGTRERRARTSEWPSAFAYLSRRQQLVDVSLAVVRRVRHRRRADRVSERAARAPRLRALAVLRKGALSCSSAVREGVEKESAFERRAPGRAERWKVKHTNQSAHALRVALGREGAVSRDAGGDGASARTSSVVLGHLARLAAAVGEESPRARHRTPRVANARDAFGRGAEARLVGDRRG